MINIAIFVSGNGSNAENITRYFQDHSQIKVKAFFCNNKEAYALQRAKTLHIPTVLFSGKELRETEIVLDQLKKYNIHYLILAGFMLKIPQNIIQQFPNRILNIHPALLPKYGGKGMYGMHVHEAVINARENKSGITIHLVNENYDEGVILFQQSCSITSDDNPESLATKVHQLEYKHYPQEIEKFIIADNKMI